MVIAHPTTQEWPIGLDLGSGEQVMIDLQLPGTL
jgi:hypothetical protein